MIRIQQIKLPLSHKAKDLDKKVLNILSIPKEDLRSLMIYRQSIDARKANQVFYHYIVDVEIKNEKKVLEKVLSNPKYKTHIQQHESGSYRFPSRKENSISSYLRPIIIGAGPAGLFCALMLAEHGFSPLVLERGDGAELRKQKVEDFWKSGLLDPESNVQFGEGGAGAFSDGKLTTSIKDTSFRSRKVLEIFTECGADPKILTWYKPHIGTDVLQKVILELRRRILRAGGEIRFRHQLSDIFIENGKIQSIEINSEKILPVHSLVLAIGHSARDTFRMLSQKGLLCKAKSFSVGFRVQHPQEMISSRQYGNLAHLCPPAEYKLSTKTSSGRSVYSFCMCPGGYVVNASSQAHHLAVNGMSYSGRNGVNANSAIVVSVNPDDFPQVENPLSGLDFQEQLERRAFSLEQGKIPIQLYGDFQKDQSSTKADLIQPQIKGAYAYSNLTSILPGTLNQDFIEAMDLFGQKIPDFNRQDCILSAVESRTSSPLRIERDEHFESNISGIFPCAEGAGYAGGITSAAIDGIKIAEAVAKQL
ncbi:hypothetical protein FACS189418_4560 [Clostridia bacterium]|nr:hypothetical protein FACS189418_4560 [Clostridia bacterium]